MARSFQTLSQIGLRVGLSSLVSFSFVAAAVAAQPIFTCPGAFVSDQQGLPVHPALHDYEAVRLQALPRVGRKTSPDSSIHKHGWRVLERRVGHITATLTVLVDNPKVEAWVIGPFNEWGQALRPGDRLQTIEGEPELASATIEGLKQGMPYRLLVDGQSVLDPAANLFSSKGFLNSVFWDHHDASAYQLKSNFVDVVGKPGLLAEVELHSLVEKFRTSSGQVGPRKTSETYRFIAESGVIKKLKEAGYTAVEMLPFNQSVDGDSWKFRYQIFGLFAPDSQFGDPSDFKRMMDAFHAEGLAVVMDVVASHVPDHGNRSERDLRAIGAGAWKKSDGTSLFVGSRSPWNTGRYDFANPYVRRFVIDGITHMMREYRIDGLRLDNVDGILGTPGGDLFLKDLTKAAREIHPRALLVAESFSPPDGLLRRQDLGGFGFNTRNDGDFFEAWHHALQGPTESIPTFGLADRMRRSYPWQQATSMKYLSNHDEAANGRDGFTGAYPATLISDEEHAFGKTKAADALNMVAGGYHLSLLQARMMQRGSFDSSSSVDWSMLESGRGKNLWDVFSHLSRYMQSRERYFAIESLTPEAENHVDDQNKIISIMRRDPLTGKELFVLINLGHHAFENYSFGIQPQGRFRLAFDSERLQFGGRGQMEGVSELRSNGHGLHGKYHSITVPAVAPYSITILEQL